MGVGEGVGEEFVGSCVVFVGFRVEGEEGAFVFVFVKGVDDAVERGV